jgi:hypothetical protein
MAAGDFRLAGGCLRGDGNFGAGTVGFACPRVGDEMGVDGTGGLADKVEDYRSGWRFDSLWRGWTGLLGVSEVYTGGIDL